MNLKPVQSVKGETKFFYSSQNSKLSQEFAKTVNRAESNIKLEPAYSLFTYRWSYTIKSPLMLSMYSDAYYAVDGDNAYVTLFGTESTIFKGTKNTDIDNPYAEIGGVPYVFDLSTVSVKFESDQTNYILRSGSEDNEGNIVARFEPRVTEVISEESSYKMLTLLQGVIDGGTGGRLRFKYGIKAQMGGNVQLHDMSNYVDDGNGTTHSHICSQCGEKETENHTFDNGVCTVCGALEDYTITVTNGIIAKGEKEIYHVGDIVNLQADTPEEGKVFAYWQDANGNKLSTKANYSFVVLQSIDLTAVYNDNYVAEEILNISAVQTSSNGKNAIRFVFNRSVDTKAEVEEVGLIYATNKLAGYTSGAKVNLTELEGFDIETVLKENTSGTVKTYKSTSTSINGTIRFTYTIGNNTDSYVYAYGYVKLADGTTVYTDLLATTYNSIG